MKYYITDILRLSEGYQVVGDSSYEEFLDEIRRAGVSAVKMVENPDLCPELDGIPETKSWCQDLQAEDTIVFIKPGRNFAVYHSGVISF